MMAWQWTSQALGRAVMALVAGIVGVSGLTALAAPAGNAAVNLLANGDIESGSDSLPAHWTFFGKSAKDWTAEDIARFHKNGRPDFAIGRAKGQWSHDQTYAGNGALLLESVDPPLQPPFTQWHGRNPVDGFWLSDPMPCAPGGAYMAGGWLKAGRSDFPFAETWAGPYDEPWFGPLELRFYDAKGNQLKSSNEVRGMHIDRLARETRNIWGYAATMPFVAPPGAVSMRLRFGQEMSATNGGWGVVLADNLTVWEVPGNVEIPKADDSFEAPAYAAWFQKATAEVKPPSYPSSKDAPTPGSCWGIVENARPGNLYDDPSKPAVLNVKVTNLRGENHKLFLRIVRTDWLGNASETITVPAERVGGFASQVFKVRVPATKSFGAFYLDIQVLESGGNAVVGHLNGRYAVMPPLNRPRTQKNIWAVTSLKTIYADGRPSERELAKLLKTAGFGLTWVRLVGDSYAKPVTEKGVEDALREIAWFRSLGIRSILQIYGGGGGEAFKRPIDSPAYEAAGRQLGTTFKDKVLAIGNWGVEQSNNRTPQRPIYRPFLDGKMMSNEEYDTIALAFYTGIKATAPNMPVLIGNMATDEADVSPDKKEGSTIRRMYGPPLNGKFDGAILNTYWGELDMIRNSLAEFDKHGDTNKTVWVEENSNPKSPISGEERRYEEGKGADNLVRWRITMALKFRPRVQAVTMWPFISPGEWGMVTPELQPRPQFVAQSVMADALGDAAFVADRSGAGLSLYEFQRGDGALLVGWTESGDHELNIQTAAAAVSLMDVMGNTRVIEARNGQVALKLTGSPVYISAKSAMSISEPK